MSLAGIVRVMLKQYMLILLVLMAPARLLSDTSANRIEKAQIAVEVCAEESTVWLSPRLSAVKDDQTQPDRSQSPSNQSRDHGEEERCSDNLLDDLAGLDEIDRLSPVLFELPSRRLESQILLQAYVQDPLKPPSTKVFN